MNALCNRLLTTAAFFGIGWGASACTAILAPRDDVQRCSTAEDCDETGDPRYVAECRFDEDNLDLDATEVDKVCIAAFKVVGCNPMNYADDHPYKMAHDSLAGMPGRYSCAGFEGLQGCAPAAGEQCANGLVINQLGVCDVAENPSTPAYQVDPAVTGEVGQDVRDAFCQSFFCEGDWVCDEDFSCVQCDPEAEIGEGGCGTVYVGGAPSCIYPADPSCGDGMTDEDSPSFGACM